MGNNIPGHVTWKILKTGTVLLNLNNGAYYTLNRTASEIWDNIIAKKDREEIVSAVCDRYDCSPEQAENDVNETLTFLLSEGLLEGGDQIKENYKEV